MDKQALTATNGSKWLPTSSALDVLMTSVTMELWADDGPSMGKDIYRCKSRAAAYRAAAKGQIPSVKVGHRRVALCIPARRQLGLEHQDAA